MLAITESCVAAASLVCKSVITVAYSGGYIYTTELLPTTVRNFGLGVVSQVIPLSCRDWSSEAARSHSHCGWCRWKALGVFLLQPR